MKENTVYIREQKEYNSSEIKKKIVEIIDSANLLVKNKTILLKPSFVYPKVSEETKGVITHPIFIRGVVRALKYLGAKKILVAEDSVIGPARVAFLSMKIKKYIGNYAEMLYLDEDEHIEVEVSKPLVQKKFIVPKSLKNADIFISLPKIKVNMFTEVSLSLKNNLGLLRSRERYKYHDERLHKKIADLYKVRPADLVIVDSIYAGEGQGPLRATPVNLGLIIAGKNMIAVDIVSSYLMGYSIEEIEHLRVLIEADLGPTRLEDIEIDKKIYLNRAKNFRRPEWDIKDLSPNIKIFAGKEKYCRSGCVGMIRSVMDAYIDALGKERILPMNIIVGRPIENIRKDELSKGNTLVVGECAREYSDAGIFVPNCPVVPSDLGLAIIKIQGYLTPPLRLRDLTRGYLYHYLVENSKLIRRKKISFTEEPTMSLFQILQGFEGYYYSQFKKIWGKRRLWGKN